MSTVTHHLLTAGVPLIVPPSEIDRAARAPRLPPGAKRVIVRHHLSDYSYLLAYCFTLFGRHISFRERWRKMEKEEEKMRVEGRKKE